jgi:hypothetical protein
MTANPHYTPDWAGRTAAAEAAHARAQAQCAAALLGSSAYRAAQEQLAAAREALRLARLARFPRIADYAAFLFTGLEAGEDGFFVLPDFGEFTTIEQADAAYARAQQRQREGPLARETRLQTGQPPGLAAFANAHEVISTWRLFGTERDGVECMASFHEAEGRYHVCLAHHWGRLHRQSNETFRRIATQLAREGILLLAPETAPVFEHEGHRQARNRELIRTANALAGRFRFYRHLLPERGLREEFARVDMVWNGAAFIDPDWSAVLYSTLPEALYLAAATPPPAPRLSAG